MPVCDLCGKGISEGQMTTLRPSVIVEATAKGYVPPRMPFEELFTAAGATREQVWQSTVDRNRNNPWGLCDGCLRSLARSAGAKAVEAATSRAAACERAAEPAKGQKPCPHCGKPLRSNLAQQCFECGADWHGSSMRDAKAVEAAAPRHAQPRARSSSKKTPNAAKHTSSTSSQTTRSPGGLSSQSGYYECSGCHPKYGAAWAAQQAGFMFEVTLKVVRVFFKEGETFTSCPNCGRFGLTGWKLVKQAEKPSDAVALGGRPDSAQPPIPMPIRILRRERLLLVKRGPRELAFPLAAYENTDKLIEAVDSEVREAFGDRLESAAREKIEKLAHRGAITSVPGRLTIDCEGDRLILRCDEKRLRFSLRQSGDCVALLSAVEAKVAKVFGCSLRDAEVKRIRTLWQAAHHAAAKATAGDIEPPEEFNAVHAEAEHTEDAIPIATRGRRLLAALSSHAARARSTARPVARDTCEFLGRVALLVVGLWAPLWVVGLGRNSLATRVVLSWPTAILLFVCLPCGAILTVCRQWRTLLRGRAEAIEDDGNVDEAAGFDGTASPVLDDVDAPLQPHRARWDTVQTNSNHRLCRHCGAKMLAKENRCPSCLRLFLPPTVSRRSPRQPEQGGEPPPIRCPAQDETVPFPRESSSEGGSDGAMPAGRQTGLSFRCEEIEAGIYHVPRDLDILSPAVASIAMENRQRKEHLLNGLNAISLQAAAELFAWFETSDPKEFRTAEDLFHGLGTAMFGSPEAPVRAWHVTAKTSAEGPDALAVLLDDASSPTGLVACRREDGAILGRYFLGGAFRSKLVG